MLIRQIEAFNYQTTPLLTSFLRLPTLMNNLYKKKRIKLFLKATLMDSWASFVWKQEEIVFPFKKLINCWGKKTKIVLKHYIRIYHLVVQWIRRSSFMVFYLQQQKYKENKDEV